jgi:hypothetical protein
MVLYTNLIRRGMHLFDGNVRISRRQLGWVAGM